MMEWCAVCLQDDVKVIASQVIQQVPLCKGCVVAYGEEKDVLRDAREFLRDLDSDEPVKAPDPEYFTPEPPPPTIKHLCICGCGAGVEGGNHLIAGHKAKSPEPTPPSTKREPDKRLTEQERQALVGPVRAKAPTIPVATGRYKLKSCACGCNTQFAPTGPRAIYADGHKPAGKATKIIRRGQEVEVQDRIISSAEIATGLKLLNQGVPMRDIAAQFNLKYTHVKHHLLRAQNGIDPHKPETFNSPTPREMSIERSQTMKVTVREQPAEERQEIQIKRKVVVLVPGARPVTQMKVTPKIAQAVWESLTLEGKAMLMDIDSMWNDWDDWLRCETVGKILLISPDEAAEAVKP